VARVSENQAVSEPGGQRSVRGQVSQKQRDPSGFLTRFKFNNLSTRSLPRQQHHHAAGGQAPIVTSTAHAKGPVRGLDFVIALILCAGRESKRTLRSVNDDAASALVWVVDKLVKAYS
jgi:hypothetical protein